VDKENHQVDIVKIEHYIAPVSNGNGLHLQSDHKCVPQEIR
jgi:hypothetical protein